MQYARTKAAVSSAGPLALYCFFILLVFGGFAGALYYQLTPTRMPNPGVGAYAPPPATVLASAPARATPLPEPVGDVAQGKPAPVTPEIKDTPPAPVVEANDPPPPAVQETPPKRKVAKRPKRERNAKSRQRNPRLDYAAQPHNNGFGSWGWNRAPQQSNRFRWF
jgi:hypothetical protein